MSGVEILASQEVVIEYAFNWVAFWIGFGITAISVIIIGALFVVYYKDELPVAACFSMFILLGLCGGIFIGCLFGGSLKTPTKYETQYKVTISDEVKMDKFCEKYEIIEQDGKIFTVRDRQCEGE